MLFENVLFFYATRNTVAICHIYQTVTFDFNSAAYNTTTLGYAQANVGTYFKSTAGGPTTIGTTASCNSYTASATTGSSVFIFQPSKSITAITVYATGTGGNRTFNSMTTSSTLNGTYTTKSSSGSGTIGSGTCGSIVITPSTAIASGTFMKIIFSGNLNVTSIVMTTPATEPTISTTTATSITGSSAISGGNISDNGGATVTARGIKYDVSSPALLNVTSDGTGNGSFSSSMTDLIANTQYYYRAYATNSIGTAYGTENNLTTLPADPIISSGNNTSAQSSANASSFTAYWTAPVQGTEAFSYTLDYSTDNTFGSGITSITGLSSSSTSYNVPGLSLGLNYYYRVKAVNTTGNSAASSTSSAITTSFPLGIILTDFHAENTGSTNQISWATLEDGYGDRMLLERGNDGISFEMIATLEGRGRNSTYTLNDSNPLAGVNYYRLKIINAKGIVAYSKIVSVNVDLQAEGINIYPNPTKGLLYIQGKGSSFIAVKLYNIIGELLINQHFNGSATIDVNRLPVGTYFLKYTINNHTEISMIQKQ